MKNEHRLMLELCRFADPEKDKIEALMQQPIDYPVVLGQLLYNRMGAAAYHTLKECGLLGRVSREFRSPLKDMYDIGREKTESFREALNIIDGMMAGVNFPYALLKGAYLASVYPTGLRTSNDIDILIKQIHISHLSERLRANGFEQGCIRNGEFVPASRMDIVSSQMNRGETVPFIKRIGLPKMEYCEIDVNFSVDYKTAQETDIVRVLLRNTRKLINDSLPTLPPADFLIHLCVHLYKEATVFNWVEMGRDLSLYKFCDIYLLIHKWKCEEYFQELRYRIHQYGLQRECYYALLYTKKLFRIENMDRLLTAVKPDDTAYLREVINPSEQKRYRYDETFINWFFCGGRKERLYEVTDETA